MIRSALIVTTEADAIGCLWCRIREGSEVDEEMKGPPFRDCTTPEGCRCLVTAVLIEDPPAPDYGLGI